MTSLALIYCGHIVACAFTHVSVHTGKDRKLLFVKVEEGRRWRADSAMLRLDSNAQRKGTQYL